jgi:hypothetical protein
MVVVICCFTRSAGGVIASFYDGTYGVDLASTATGGSVQTYNTNQNLNLNTYGTGEITFTVAGSSEAVRVDSDGNVGIGLSSSIDGKLHIAEAGECKFDIEDTGGQDYRIFVMLLLQVKHLHY